jgi:hypothetical protein
MSHPSNKRERLEYGNRKAQRRTKDVVRSIKKSPYQDVSRYGEDWEDTYVGRHRDTTTTCKGLCCTNPRKSFGEKTVDELSDDDYVDEEFEFFYDNDDEIQLDNGDEIVSTVDDED